MSGPELDALLTREDTPWRPSMAFMADLTERLDAVDGEIEAERDHIPQDGARGHDSVLFSLDDLLGSGRGPASSARHRPSSEVSGVIDLARLTAGPPDALDSGPLPVGQDPALARRRGRTRLWLAAAGFVLAAGAAWAVGGPKVPTDLPPGVPIDVPVAESARATSHAPATLPGSNAAALAGAALADSARPGPPRAVLAEAPSTLRACLTLSGAPASALITWLAGRPDASPRAGADLSEPVRACLVSAARSLEPRAEPLLVTAPR